MQKYRMILHLQDDKQIVDGPLAVKEWISDWILSNNAEDELTVLRNVFNAMKKDKGQ